MVIVTSDGSAGPFGESIVDPNDVRLVLGVDKDTVLGSFNRAGILGPADVHVAMCLGRLGPEIDEDVLLAAALAVRAPRVGHVCVDLASVRENVALDTDVEVDIDALPWPEEGEWLSRIAASPMVAVGEDPAHRPLRLAGASLYLDRHWRDERLLASSLRERAEAPGPAVDMALLSEGLRHLFPDEASSEQRWAAAAAVTRRLTVVAGGPGTGKTTTVARLLLLLDEQARAASGRRLMVALAAPTGKAANRMQEAVSAELSRLDVDDETARRLGAIGGSTLHRLLGTQPGNASRFRHDRHHHLPHDVVIVDETSMVASALMARLVEAVRPDARLILLGDPQQLASVESGAVLEDVVGPNATRMRVQTPTRVELESLTGTTVPVDDAAPDAPAITDSIVLLRTNFRFSGTLGDLASAIRDGDVDRAMEVLRGRDEAVGWLDIDPGSASEAALGPVREVARSWGVGLRTAALAGDAAGALGVLGSTRILCAHRRGRAGVGVWNQRIEAWLAEDDPDRLTGGPWYPGRPVMVTANDYTLRLFNGDSGVSVLLPDERRGVSFARPAGADLVSPSRLGSIETVYATTIHKSQGSEFATVVVLLPEVESRLLSRELLYTAVTRTTQRLLLVGSEDSVRQALTRRISRNSGLSALLWGQPA